MTCQCKCILLVWRSGDRGRHDKHQIGNRRPWDDVAPAATVSPLSACRLDCRRHACDTGVLRLFLSRRRPPGFIAAAVPSQNRVSHEIYRRPQPKWGRCWPGSLEYGSDLPELLVQARPAELATFSMFANPISSHHRKVPACFLCSWRLVCDTADPIASTEAPKAVALGPHSQLPASFDEPSPSPSPHPRAVRQLQPLVMIPQRQFTADQGPTLVLRMLGKSFVDVAALAAFSGRIAARRPTQSTVSR